jgi:hypothetical protein
MAGSLFLWPSPSFGIHTARPLQGRERLVPAPEVTEAHRAPG